MKELEIFEYEGAGYDRTMNFETWRVAIANFGEKFDREIYDKLERHLLTDEVFVLLSGSASLIIGKDMKEYVLEPGKIYNVKKGVWHNVLLEKDAKVLIVENHNTSLENTEYYNFKGEN
ncbi:MAG: cupin domain-containing protein [Clostridia bacterium]|nr:cupin domain-containing protein [Clostridia bacterium]